MKSGPGSHNPTEEKSGTFSFPITIHRPPLTQVLVFTFPVKKILAIHTLVDGLQSTSE